MTATRHPGWSKADRFGGSTRHRCRHTSRFPRRSALPATANETVALADVAPRRAGASTAQRVLRRPQLSRARQRGRRDLRQRAQASRRADLLHQSDADRDRRCTSRRFICKPTFRDEYDFEAELAVVIGTDVQGRARSRRHERDLRVHGASTTSPRAISSARTCSGSKERVSTNARRTVRGSSRPMKSATPATLEIMFRLNGVEKQHSNTAQDDLQHSALDRRTLQRHDALAGRRDCDRNASKASASRARRRSFSRTAT